MGIRYKTGNLLDAPVDYICQQVNCQGRMGSGIAKQIREKWPLVYEEYAFKCNGPKDKNVPLLGSVQFVETFDCTVINLFAQQYYGYDGKRYTSYDAFWACLGEIKEKVPKGSKIGFPYKIGCGLGGASWPVIFQMIDEVLGEDFQVYIYTLEV
jgi:O-acetyl-ADP-ribose deacetylase (regulator of RNase III)